MQHREQNYENNYAVKHNELNNSYWHLIRNISYNWPLRSIIYVYTSIRKQHINLLKIYERHNNLQAKMSNLLHILPRRRLRETVFIDCMSFRMPIRWIDQYWWHSMHSMYTTLCLMLRHPDELYSMWFNWRHTLLPKWHRLIRSFNWWYMHKYLWWIVLWRLDTFKMSSLR